MMKIYLINLRSISTFSVILLHVCAMYIKRYSVDSSLWNVCNLVDSAVRFCVPIFLMISGALLLGKDEPFLAFFNKRFKRVLIPFLVWNFIYFLLKVDYKNVIINDVGVDFMRSFLWGASYHFWYIYMILGIYLFIPIIRKWTTTCSKQECSFFLVMWLITLFKFDTIAKFFPNLELLYFSKYLGYLILGFYIDKYITINRRNLILGIVFIFTGLLATYYLTSYLSHRNKYLISTFYEYLTPNVMLTSVGVFMLGKYLKSTSSKLLFFDTYSYGIYLIHILVLDFLFDNDVLIYKGDNDFILFLHIAVLAIVILLISLAIISIMSRVKGLQKYIT